MEQSSLSMLYRCVSLWLIACAIALRLFLPGLTVEMGENALVWLLAWAGFLFVVVDAMFSQKWQIRQVGLTLPIILWIGMAFFSILWAGDKVQAIYQSMIWLSDLLLFFSVCYWAKEKSVLKYFVCLLLSCFCLEVVFSLYQYFIGLPAMRSYLYAYPELVKEIDLPKSMENFFQTKLRIPHVFGHFTLTNSLGGYIILYIPLLGILLWKEKKKKIVLSVIFISSLAALCMTASRGSILSLLAALGIFTLVLVLKSLKPKISIVLSSSLLLGSFVFYALVQYSSCLDFIGKYGLTFVMRIAYWEAGLKIIANNFLFGTGVGNFKHHYYTYKYPWAEEVNKVHNGYLEWTIETGFAGTLILCFLVWKIFSFLQNTHDKESLSGGNQEEKNLFFTLFVCVAVFSLSLSGIMGRSFDFSSLHHWLCSLGFENFFQSSDSALAYMIGFFSILLWILLYRFFDSMSFENLALGLKLGILSFAIHNFIDIDFYEPTISQNFWIFLSILVCLENKKNILYAIPVPGRVVSFLIVLLIVCQLSFYSMPSLMQLAHLKKSLVYLGNSLETEKNKSEKERVARQYTEDLQDALRLGYWDDKLQILQAKKNIQEAVAFVYSQSKEKISIPHLQLFLENNIKQLEVVTKYKPKSVAFYFALVFLYQEETRIWDDMHRKENYEIAEKKAQESMEKLLAIYPEKILFLKIAGEMAEKKGKKQKALEYYQKALYISDLDPNDIEKTERQNIIQRILFLRSR
ncbi:MAG: O-antigen ligase family protein [Candidatus Brocadiae bacterium]|nr:O-antigen ligase family protein [Candidatus Brocadiia bacterium]